MMSEERAFWAAIAAHPDEDTPRLVYADWLDEHGRSGQANFIRVQVAEEALPEGDPQRGELHRRAAMLYAMRDESWFPFLADTPVEYKRGMPNEVTVTRPEQLFSGSGTELTPLGEAVRDGLVPQVYINEIYIEDHDVPRFTQSGLLGNIKALHLGHIRHGDWELACESLNHYLSIPMPKLHRLFIHGPANAISIERIGTLAREHSLRHLMLQHAELDEDSLQELAAIPLDGLTVEHSNLQPATLLAAIAQSPVMQEHLQELGVQHYALNQDAPWHAQVLPQLDNLRRLKALHVQGCCPEALNAISEVPAMQENLEALKVIGQGLMDPQPFSRLRKLNITDQFYQMSKEQMDAFCASDVVRKSLVCLRGGTFAAADSASALNSCEKMHGFSYRATPDTLPRDVFTTLPDLAARLTRMQLDARSITFRAEDAEALNVLPNLDQADFFLHHLEHDALNALLEQPALQRVSQLNLTRTQANLPELRQLAHAKLPYLEKLTFTQASGGSSHIMSAFNQELAEINAHTRMTMPCLRLMNNRHYTNTRTGRSLDGDGLPLACPNESCFAPDDIITLTQNPLGPRRKEKEV